MKRIAILREAFGDQAFTPTEAALILDIDDPGPALNALKKQGLIQRLGRSQYRLASQDRPSAIRLTQYEILRNHLVEFPGTVGLDGPDAVAAWTQGRWTTAQTPGARLLHLAVDERDWDTFTNVLTDAGIAWGTPGEPPRRGDIRVIVRRQPDLAVEWVDEEPVITKDAVLGLIRENPVAYAGADKRMIHDLPKLVADKREEILAICARNGASNVHVFGSVSRADTKPTSDVDLLVDLSPDRSLLDRIHLQHELEDLLGVKVDVVTRRGLHPLLREDVLSEAIPV